MDEQDAGRRVVHSGDRTELRAGPASLAVGALLAGAAVLAVLGALDPGGGRVLAWPGAAVLLAAGLRDLALRPVLRAGADGVEVVVGLRRRTARWRQVQRIRTVRDRRTLLLELDLGDTLVLLSRWRLGRAPDDVAARLSALQRGDA